MHVYLHDLGPLLARPPCSVSECFFRRSFFFFPHASLCFFVPATNTFFRYPFFCSFSPLLSLSPIGLSYDCVNWANASCRFKPCLQNFSIFSCFHVFWPFFTRSQRPSFFHPLYNWSLFRLYSSLLEMPQRFLSNSIHFSFGRSKYRFSPSPLVILFFQPTFGNNVLCPPPPKQAFLLFAFLLLPCLLRMKFTLYLPCWWLFPLLPCFII